MNSLTAVGGAAINIAYLLLLSACSSRDVMVICAYFSMYLVIIAWTVVGLLIDRFSIFNTVSHKGHLSGGNSHQITSKCPSQSSPHSSFNSRLNQVSIVSKKFLPIFTFHSTTDQKHLLHLIGRKGSPLEYMVKTVHHTWNDMSDSVLGYAQTWRGFWEEEKKGMKWLLAVGGACKYYSSLLHALKWELLIGLGY